MSVTKSKIGILYIATGRYTIFWEEFYQSAEQYFMPECEKHYFVFTDNPENIRHQGNAHLYHQDRLGWPYDTLMRFDIFLKAESALIMMDYLYFFNANLRFIAPISFDDFTDPKLPLLGILHPGFWNKKPDEFTYDRNPKSRAYIPQGAGHKYFMGGGNGGETPRFLALIRDLSARIHADLDDGIIAIWHDESHLNRYFFEHPDEIKTLPVIYSTPEEWAGGFLAQLRYVSVLRNRGVKIVIRNKANPWYGGHAWLRGQTDVKRFGRKDRLKLLLYSLISKICP